MQGTKGKVKMKKTLKLLLIFIGGLTAIIAGAIGGYFIISKNRTFYIYDVRLVEPIDGMSGYIYTDKEGEYTSINNQTVYMNSTKTNIYPIAVFASSSINSTDVKITSSDPTIAKIIYKNGACFVQYLKEGFVTITSELHGVKDSFSIQIYDQLPSDFNVYDYEYYGDYAELFPNTLVSYADNEEYRYKYFLNNVSNTGNNTNVDGDLIRLDQSNLDESVFSSVYIDSATNELVVKCKTPDVAQKDNIDSTIVLQSFYYSEDGKVVIENEYIVKIHIVLYIPEFLQLEVSSTPDFDEGIVYTNTQKIDISSITDEEILADPSLLDDYLSAEKAENYLSKNGEKATYNVYLTDRVKKLYVRVRMVYTNGDIVYLKDGNDADFTISNPALCKIGPTNDYYIMTLDKTNYFTSSSVASFDIGVSVKGFTFSFNFEFLYRESTAENISLFYDYNSETKIYTYKYWDERARFINEIYDEQGNVIGFGA